MSASRRTVSPDWLAPLLARLDAAIGQGATAAASGHGTDTGMLERRDEVRLALATAARLSLDEAADPGPQLVVLGPTQAGKSTLVNRLLDTEIAGVSALAGHTVHAQAFVSSATETVARERLPALLQPLRPVARDDLDATRLDAWSLQPVSRGEHAVAPTEATVWDTPDFDSISAGTYREAVTLTTALADALVLVVSKDKYGDRSVWQRLRTLRALGTPLVLVVNKVDRASRDLIAGTLAERLERQGSGPAGDGRDLAPGHRTTPALILLPWVDRPGDQAPLVLPGSARRELGNAIGNALVAAEDRTARKEALQRFITTRRDHWLAPLRIEQAARERWEMALNEAGRELVENYQHRWLDGDEHDDAFDRTLVELLTLLEVPGIARVLMRTRQAVTWPARRLLGLGMGTASRLARGAGSRLRGRSEDEPATPAERERRLLDGLLKERLTELRERILEERESADEHGFWRELDSAFVAARPALANDWSVRAVALRDDLQPRIDAAATRLYQQLQTQPALLNTLRATRVGTDAAGVALAIKTGGMAPADLVLAPAMLSVTTLLTESALGRYLDGVRRELERAQREAVESTLVKGLLVPRLQALSPGGDARDSGEKALRHEIAASRERVATDGE